LQRGSDGRAKEGSHPQASMHKKKKSTELSERRILIYAGVVRISWSLFFPLSPEKVVAAPRLLFVQRGSILQ
jgi:hypothetical protein